MAASVTDSDPLQPTVQFVERAIETQKKELNDKTPNAKNPKLQAELAKVFATYQQVITSSIQNLTQQKSLYQELSTLLGKGVSTDPKSLSEMQQQLTLLQTKLNTSIENSQKYEPQLKTLQGRITELMNVD
ncbi:MAG: hypothetical protein ACRDFB_07220 [Rhabdochlamydiaceae bacterium]